jgi:hypothetical protein
MNRRQILVILARLAALAMAVEVGTIWVCESCFWTPIQRHYLPSFIWCSLPAIAPATIEVQLIWKAGSHRKRELASDDDAVASDDVIGMAISQSALDAGWKGLSEGPPQRVSVARFSPALTDLAFDGEDLREFLFLPEMCGLVVFCVSLCGWFFLRGLIRELISEFAWRRRLAAANGPSSGFFEQCAEWPQQLGSLLASLHSPAPHCIALQSTVPAVASNRTESPVRSASFALPLFGVYDGTDKGGYLWSQKHEIE